MITPSLFAIQCFELKNKSEELNIENGVWGKEKGKEDFRVERLLGLIFRLWKFEFDLALTVVLEKFVNFEL